MSQNPGGFFLPGQQQQQGGYPPQQGAQGPGPGYPPIGGGPYTPQNIGYPAQQLGYNPQQQGYPPQQSGYPPQPSGYPHHQMPTAQQGGVGYPPQYPPQQASAVPQGGGMYPPLSGNTLPYVTGPNVPSGHQGGYPPSNPGYPQDAHHQAVITGRGLIPPGEAKISQPSSAMDFELSVSCRNLRDEDMFSKSDPFCVLSKRDTFGGSWTEVGRTEKIDDSHDPAWQKKFALQYNSQTTQELKFEVYDWDSRSQELKKQDALGVVEVSLGTIISSPGKQFISSLKQGKGGRITIMAEKVSTDRQIIKLQLMAHRLDRMDTFGKSDPFLTLARKCPLVNGLWCIRANT